MNNIQLFIKVLLEKHQVKVKFLIVGTWNTLFGYIVFVVLDTTFQKSISIKYVAYMSALVLSNIISIINAFIFHKFITFKSPVKGLKIIPEFLKFFLTYIATFSLSLILMPVFVELFGINTKISAALIIFICTIISYLGHSRFSFKNQKTVFKWTCWCCFENNKSKK